MKGRWDNLDNAIVDLWTLFLPPIVNFVILAAIFNDVSIKITASGVESLVTFFREALDGFGSITAENNLFLFIGKASEHWISVVILLAVLVFLLNKLTLFMSRMLFGKINLIEDRFTAHPAIAGLVQEVIHLDVNKLGAWPLERIWPYTVTANDCRDNLTNYSLQRNRFAQDIATNRILASYASAYAALAPVSYYYSNSESNFIFGALPTSILICVLSIVAFMFFVKNYLQSCIRLARTDMLAFVNFTIASNSFIPEAMDSPSDTKNHFGHYVQLADDNIFKSLSDMAKQTYQVGIASVVYAKRLSVVRIKRGFRKWINWLKETN